MSDFITLMAPVNGAPTTKRLYRGQTGELLSVPAPFFTHYRAGQVSVGSFSRLATVLEMTSQDPAWFVVRGAILPGADKSNMRRAHVTDPTLGPAEHRWILLDLDKWRALDLPAEVFAADPAKYAAEARVALPACFREAACWWQATGSAGIKSGARLRLAFWLSKPLSDEQCKRWCDQFDIPVDLAVFTPSQPTFTGRPILDGVPDPVPGPRSGVLPGRDQVEVPDFTDARKALGADDELRAAARRIKRTEEGERRNVLNRLAFSLAARYHEEELPAARLAQALLAAATEAGLPALEAATTVQAAVKDGRVKNAAEREGWRGQLAKDKQDLPKSTAANVSLYLCNHPAFLGKLSFDERAQRPLWTEQPPWGGQVPRPVDETDEVRAIEWFQAKAWIDAKVSWVRAGLIAAAREHAFDPIQDYLGRLPQWDQRSRLDTFFIRHLGVDDTELMRAQTRCWFIQAVRRAYASSQEPVQADYLIVLSGPQGLRKSSLLRALCPLPRFFRDDLPDISSKDARAAVADSWIVELSELTHRKADRDTFKAFATARVDKFRPAYGRNEVEMPRRAVLVGSTNEAEFLTDPTGNRRFWPMLCTHQADVTEAMEERDQLWAEAVCRANAGELAYLSHELEAAARQVQEDFREEDAVEEELATMLRKPVDFTRPVPGECLNAAKCIVKMPAREICMNLGLDPKNNWHLARVKAAFRRLRWSEKRGVNRTRYFVPPPDWSYEVTQTLGAGAN